MHWLCEGDFTKKIGEHQQNQDDLMKIFAWQLPSGTLIH